MTELIVQESSVLARAALDTQITTAKAYPRDINKAIAYATQLATLDEETAQSCFYALPRKDKGSTIVIKGESVRLAEIVASAWGNLHAATRIVSNDGRTITTEGVCWDLETNVKIAMQDTVSIIFGQKDGKGGYQASADMQVMLTKASSAKALRNAIFKVIPKALVRKIYQKAIDYSVGDVKTLSAKVTAVVSKLVKMGINQSEMFDYFGKTNFAEFTADDLTALIGMGTALKDGMLKPEEVFKIVRTQENDTSASERVNQLIAAKSAPKLEGFVNAETGEIN